MTLLDRTNSRAGSNTRLGLGRESGRQQDQGEDRGSQQAQQNVGDGERAVSVAAGSIVALLGLGRRTVPGLLMAGLGGALVYRGVTGHCPAYESLGLDTAREADGRQRQSDDQTSTRGVHVAQAFLINRPAQQLYDFWRNFENLPRIMTHLERVTVTGDRRSHWVARAPRMAGGQVEWDAEITRDDPNELIAWRSLPGADVENSGQIRFSPALGDRGTEVHVDMQYVPIGGKLGHLIAALSGNNPKRIVREDLRNFKRLMEVGEILTIIGQPHGTCTGQGERYTESEWRPLFM